MNVFSSPKAVVLLTAFLPIFLSSILIPLTTRGETISWERHHPPATNFRFSSIAYGDGQFVAVGVGGQIITSLDGREWVPQDSGTFQNLNAVVHTGAEFIAVGTGGVFLTSEDGAIWDKQVLNTEVNLVGVAQGNGRIVAVSTEGEAWVRSDGDSWSEHQTGVNPRALAFGNDDFIAVGLDGGIAASSDGENWATQSVGTGTNLFSIGFGDNRTFVAAGTDGRIFSSIDGGPWEERSSPIPAYRSLRTVAFIQDRWQAFTVSGESAVSTDSVTWELRQISTSDLVQGVAESPELVVGVTTQGSIIGSEDADDWEDISNFPRPWIEGIGYFGSVPFGGPRWVAAGGGRGNTAVLVSEDGGQTWSASLEGVYYGISSLATGTGDRGPVAVMIADGTVVFTKDLMTWEQPSDAVVDGLRLQVVVRKGHLFIAGGRNGALLTSLNGELWTQRESGLTSSLMDFTSGPGGFVGISGNGDIIHSIDGESWNRVKTGAGSLRSVAFENGFYVALGGGGAVVRSANGLDWETFDSGPPSARIASIPGLPGRFVASGSDGIWTSLHGQHWTFRALEGIGESLHVRLHYTFRTLWAYGSSGTLLSLHSFPPSPSGNRSWPMHSDATLRMPWGSNVVQWLKDGIEIPGETEATLTVENVGAADAGKYQARLLFHDRIVTTDVLAVTVVPESYAMWRHRMLATNPEWENEEMLLRYAFGMPDTRFAPSHFPRPIRVAESIDGEEKEYLALSYLRRIQPPGLEYRIERSFNLSDWTDISDEVQVSIEEALTEGAIEVERVTVRAPFSDSPSYFLRVMIVHQ